MRRLGIVLVLLASLSCSDGGNAAGFCRRLRDLVDELDGISEEEFRERISADSLGDPGGVLSEGRDRLEAAVEAGDEAEAFDETQYLLDQCVHVEQ